MRIAGAAAPVDGFFEWKTIKAAKQPYAIAMKDGKPFAIGGLAVPERPWTRSSRNCPRSSARLRR
jgi:putative SOS response-associated peptidase YedK